jgi:hypothetical protein
VVKEDMAKIGEDNSTENMKNKPNNEEKVEVSDNSKADEVKEDIPNEDKENIEALDNCATDEVKEDMAEIVSCSDADWHRFGLKLGNWYLSIISVFLYNRFQYRLDFWISS